MRKVIAVALALALAPALRAQTPDTARADSVHRLKPISAFWRSLLIPGWGQAATQRWVTGAAFVTWEGTCIMMTLKAQDQLEHIRAVGAGHAKSKRSEKEDWITLWVFNHFFAGAEAFVSGHLQDFPKDLHVRAIPNGIGITFPLPRP